MSNESIERKIARKVIRALKANGTPVTKVWDGEDIEKVSTEEKALEVLFSTGYGQLITASGAWVLIIEGNEEDAISDWTLDIDDVMTKVVQSL